MIPDSNLKRIRELEKTINDLRDQMIFVPPTNDLSLSFGNLGSRNAAHGVLTGMEALQPIVHLLTDVDTNGVSTGDFNKINLMSSNAIVDRTGFTNIELKYIQKTSNDGQRIGALTVAAGKTLTLQTGGNMAITSDIILDENTLVYLVYSSDLGNKYRVLTSSSGAIAGANTSLSNLTTTSINESLIPQAGKSLGSSSALWSSVFSNNYKMGTAGVIDVALSMIFGNTDGMVLNIPTSKAYDFRVGGTSQILISSGGIITCKGLITSGTLGAIALSDTVSYAGFNGAIYREGSDVKVFTGGVEVNLSSLSVGANTALSNLTSPTSINQSLIPQSGKSLGGSSDLWSSVWANNFKLGTAGVIDATLNMICGKSTGLEINVPSSKNLSIKVADSTIGFFDNNGLTMQTGKYVSTRQLTLNLNAVSPSIAGVMTCDGTSIFAYSGGVVKNFTQMPQLNSVNTFTNANVFNSIISMNAPQFLILNANDTSDTYIRQSTNAGVTPKKLDLAVFADVIFQGIGETTTARSRGMIKAMSKAGDIIASELPSGYACAVKNTSSGQSYMAYNDGGTIKKAFFA